jgi:iron complex outermembrane receptor protein
MRKIVFSFIFLACVFFVENITAQSYGILRGAVMDLSTKEAITGAAIYDAEDITRGVTSDINGNYELRMSIGKHRMVCSFISMRPDTFIVFIDSLKTTEYNVMLRSSAVQLQTTVISAGKYEQRLEEITVSMEVLKPALIENKNSSNIKSALDQAPGLNILDGEPQIRGGSGFSFGVGSRVAILLDGLPVLAGDAGRPEWNFIPVENVEQIEIIKGASSVTYGSSALSGSINIRTAYPKDKPFTKVNLSSGVYDSPSVDSAKWWKGTANFTNLSFLHSQKFGQTDLVVGGMGIYDHGYIGPPSFHPSFGSGNDTISEEEVGEKTGRINFSLRYRPKKFTQMNYGLNGNFMKSTNNFSLVWDNDSSGLYRAFPKTMTLQDQTILYVDPFINYYAKGGLTHTLRARYLYANNKNGNAQSNETSIVFSEYQFNKKLNQIEGLNVTGGIVMNQTFSHAELYNNGTSPDNRLQNYAAYTQLDKKLFKVLNASLGFRGEYFKMNEEEYVAKPIFRSGLNLKLAQATYLRYSYGQGYRFPTITEKFIRTSTGGLDVFSNPGLQPETSWNTEVGIKQGFKVNNFVGFLDIAAFWQEYSNTIEFTYGFWDKNKDQFGDDSLAAGFKFINTGDTRVRGFEAALAGEGKLSKDLTISILAGYTYVLPQAVNPDQVFAVDSTPQEMTYNFTSTDTTDNILKYRFKHIAKADLQITYKRISIGGSWRYYTFMQNIDLTFYRLEPVLHSGIEKYRDEHHADTHVFDVRIGVDVSKKFKIAFVVNNATNLSYSLRPLKMESPRTFALQLSLKV